jgi:hypothetical protein
MRLSVRRHTDGPTNRWPDAPTTLRLFGSNMGVLTADCRTHPQVASTVHEVIVR